MTGDLKDWITLAAIPELGALSVKRLWDAGWSPERLFNADITELRQAGIKPKAAEALSLLAKAGHCTVEERVERALEWAAHTTHGRILTVTCADYPKLLREIADPPPILFCKGDISALAMPQLAVVGSRNPTTTGQRNAYNFSSYLAQNGLVITSGLALGIDTEAHRGCVAHNCPTVAVLGTGMASLYPYRNHKLTEQILDTGGCLVTEFFPDVPPHAQNFPRRNRIISGMSLGVLVVEAALKSGSLITARMALEQNRDVFAIPGPLNNPMSKGCHKLIKSGAHLTESAADIMTELGHLLGTLDEAEVSVTNEQELQNQKQDSLNDAEKRLIKALGYERQSLDQIVLSTGLATQEVNQLLVSLELKGWISQSQGGYTRV